MKSLLVIYVRIGPNKTVEFIRDILNTSSEVNIIPEKYIEDNRLPIIPLDKTVNSKGIHSTIVFFYSKITERLYVAER